MRVSAEQSPVTSVTLFQLRPNTFYELTVLARNRIGDALFSDTVSVRTKGWCHRLVNTSRTVRNIM